MGGAGSPQLLQKGGAALGNVVGRAHAREHAIHDVHPHAGRRHKGPHLPPSQACGQRSLVSSAQARMQWAEFKRGIRRAESSEEQDAMHAELGLTAGSRHACRAASGRGMQAGCRV